PHFNFPNKETPAQWRAVCGGAMGLQDYRTVGLLSVRRTKGHGVLFSAATCAGGKAIVAS
ncbi:jg92, partial [Pararge aegeria aegeria]